MAKTSITKERCVISNKVKKELMLKYATCDMYQPYIDLAKEMFPNAKIVIDKFHIVQLLTRCMQKLRINVMKDFKTTSKEYKKFKRYWKIPLKKVLN